MPSEIEMVSQDWSFFCDYEVMEQFDAYFSKVDLDENDLLTFNEVENAVESFVEDAKELAFVKQHLKDAFKIADMKEYHEAGIQDGRISRFEAENFFHQCIGGQPKVFWAFLHLSEAQQFAQKSADPTVPDYHAAEVIGEMGGDRNYSLMMLLEAEQRESFKGY